MISFGLHGQRTPLGYLLLNSMENRLVLCVLCSCVDTDMFRIVSKKSFDCIQFCFSVLSSVDKNLFIISVNIVLYVFSNVCNSHSNKNS